MRYSWDFFTDLLDNMADLQMLKLKEKDDVSATHMRQMGTPELRREETSIGFLFMNCHH